MPPHWQCKPMDKRFFVLTESIENPYQYCWNVLSLTAEKPVVPNNSFKELKKKTVMSNETYNQ